MSERIEMEHPEYTGKARPLVEDVPKWEAAGWKICPARGLAPAKQRASTTAKRKGNK
jgi:hypothetical protein